MSDFHQVVTPENIELDYEIAGIGSRFMALMIDVLVQGLLTAGIFYGFSLVDLDRVSLTAEIQHLSHSLIGAGLLALLALVWIGYYIILETALNGQTLGKKLVNIRVRKDRGYAPAFWDILLRNLIRLIDFFPFGYATGFITMFLNSNAKRLGDFAAGTIVVKELSRKKITPYLNHAILVAHTAEVATDERFSWLNPLLGQITQQEYFLLYNLYSRRSQLTNYAQLAQKSLVQILGKNWGQEALAIAESDAPEILAQLIRRYEQTHFL